jgi:hypothetical protein
VVKDIGIVVEVPDGLFEGLHALLFGLVSGNRLFEHVWQLRKILQLVQIPLECVELFDFLPLEFESVVNLSIRPVNLAQVLPQAHQLLVDLAHVALNLHRKK